MDTAARTDVARGAPDRESLPLGAVDLALVVGLVLFGQLSHGINPITEPLASAETVVPFAAGWIVASLLAGLYTRGLASSVGQITRLTAVTWLAAANLGFILRASPLFEGGAPWTFTVVMTGFGFLVLVGWRVGYAIYLVRS